MLALVEERRRQPVDVCPVRPEVVVHDVEDHPEADRVGGVYEGPQVVGLAVEPGRREQVHAVVAPAERPGEIRDRHHLDQRDADLLQERQLLPRGRPRAGRREGADMHLVDDLTFQPDAGPVPVAPRESPRIDDL